MQLQKHKVNILNNNNLLKLLLDGALLRWLRSHRWKVTNIRINIYFFLHSLKKSDANYLLLFFRLLNIYHQ